MKPHKKKTIVVIKLIACRPDAELGKQFAEIMAELGVDCSELAKRAIKAGLKKARNDLIKIKRKGALDVLKRFPRRIN